MCSTLSYFSIVSLLLYFHLPDLDVVLVVLVAEWRWGRRWLFYFCVFLVLCFCPPSRSFLFSLFCLCFSSLSLSFVLPCFPFPLIHLHLSFSLFSLYSFSLFFAPSLNSFRCPPIYKQEESESPLPCPIVVQGGTGLPYLTHSKSWCLIPSAGVSK